jgi:hypothetical protein
VEVRCLEPCALPGFFYTRATWTDGKAAAMGSWAGKPWAGQGRALVISDPGPCDAPRRARGRGRGCRCAELAEREQTRGGDGRGRTDAHAYSWWQASAGAAAWGVAVYREHTARHGQGHGSRTLRARRRIGRRGSACRMGTACVCSVPGTSSWHIVWPADGSGSVGCRRAAHPQARCTP